MTSDTPGGPRRPASATTGAESGISPGRDDRAAGGVASPLGANALARCVAVEPAKFATAHWGRTPLLSRAAELGNPLGFTDLLSPDDADELLSRRGLRTPFLRVAKDGQLLPAARYTGSGGSGAEIGDQVLDERVLDLYAGGATLVLQGLHRNWPPLVDFARELGAALGQPLQVNAYLTPAGSQGFATHYDTHDVFVLQVAGRKHWRIHEPVLPDPLERQPWGGRADEVSAVAEGPPALDVTLAPGDALYLPRGWLHSAQAQEESSLHLTVGIRAMTRYALVETLLELAATDRRLRASLPYGLDVADADQVEPELTETVEALRDWLVRADPVAVAARLRERAFPASRPAPIRPLAQARAIAELDARTPIAPRAGLRWQLDDESSGDGPGDAAGAGRVVLRVFDRTVSFPGQCRPALRALLRGEVGRVGDLPGLDTDEDRIVLARRLLREAVAVTP
ncbi:cupin domain-containing protein [Micromonospora sp. NPDC049559]|uniref:cupin domain-containing protein n=1 Tax=Micromonospora sp. NPDC049559 TaxID=3155923 RepID=UPI003418A65A